MEWKRVTFPFIVLTFCIAYSVSGVLILLGQSGYKVYDIVNAFQQFAMNIPFAVYILSPAIASYIVLKKSNLSFPEPIIATDRLTFGCLIFKYCH